MGAWVIGRNEAGYLPESDTYACAEREDAVTALIADMQDYADTDDDSVLLVYGGWPYDEPSMRAIVDSILKDDGPGESGDWSCWAADHDDRQIVFWLVWEPSREPDEE